MPGFTRLVPLLALLAVLPSPDALAGKKTVCTITVNSADEREVFRRNLPPDQFDFVELVERGRPDWLASACQSGVSCDVLLISGHFDAGTEFYSDRLDAREFLAVDEMERASCSESCPGLFSKLKEVYLFGCNTLNGEALRSTSAEIVRSYMRGGHSAADAERRSHLLGEQHAGSNRDRMRQIFKDVPVIYGFSSKAPLGRSAAPVLDRYFEAGYGEIGSGRASARLSGLFAPVSMTVAAGLVDSEPQAGYRSDVCRFSDDRLSPAQKLEFVHRLLKRDPAEIRMFLDLVEKHAASLDANTREAPEVTRVLESIARDGAARDRYLEFARDADQASTRARMLDLARALGWLSAEEHRHELARMIGDQLAARSVGSPEVDVACTLNKTGRVALADLREPSPATRTNTVAHSAIRACLGSAEAHARVLQALTGPSDDDARIAQVYLQHRPIADVNDVRAITAGIARMNGAGAQVRALDALARHATSDQESLDALARLFPRARSLEVQRGIAGVLIRADYQASQRPELVRALRQHRLKSPDGEDLIDVLIRRLQRIE